MLSIIDIVTIIAMVAAVIAAIPIVRDWLPIKLSDKERDVLLLAKVDDGYPYMILFVCGLSKRSYVQTPFKHDSNIYVSDEIASLTCKKTNQCRIFTSGWRLCRRWAICLVHVDSRRH